MRYYLYFQLQHAINLIQRAYAKCSANIWGRYMRYFRRSYNLFNRNSDQRGSRVGSDGDSDGDGSTESNEPELQSSDESDNTHGGNGGDSNRRSSMICGLCNCVAEVMLLLNCRF